jgi:hypothetical protein
MNSMRVFVKQTRFADWNGRNKESPFMAHFEIQESAREALRPSRPVGKQAHLFFSIRLLDFLDISIKRSLQTWNTVNFFDG